MYEIDMFYLNDLKLFFPNEFRQRQFVKKLKKVDSASIYLKERS